MIFLNSFPLRLFELKQIEWQIFLQQRWVGPGENCNLGSATMVSHWNSHSHKEWEGFYREEMEDGKAIINKESMAFIDWVLIRKEIFLLVGLYCHRAWKLPIPVSQLFFFFCLFRAVPEAYGGSQARGGFVAVTAGLCHSNARSEPHLQPIPQLMAVPDP